MTDRYNSFIVILEKDIRSDDAEQTINALKMIRGVLKVEHITSAIDYQIAHHRVSHELRMKLYDILK